MRLTVLGDTLGPRDERMRRAAQGLALRGHEICWRERAAPRGSGIPVASVARVPGPEVGWPPETFRAVRGIAPLLRIRSDLVIGSGERVGSTAVAGWLVGAHGMVVTLEPETASRWSPIQHWCWESLPGRGLVAEGVEPSAIERDRLGRWSGARVPEVPSATHPDTETLERLAEGLRARRRGHGPRPAAFLDRDGTLVVERGYLSDADDLQLLPGVPEALRRLQASGLALVLVSNQSGVGRGMFPLSRVYEAMGRLRVMLRRHGVELDGVYFCPHRPEEGCECRKPGTGLLRRAASDLGLSLGDSVMIGDKRIDAACGQAAGGRGILVRTGYGRAEAAKATDERTPDAVCDDLRGAVRWLLERMDEP